MSLPAERHLTPRPAEVPAPRRRPSHVPAPRRSAPREGPRAVGPRARVRRRSHRVGFAIAATVLLAPMVLGIAGLNALLAQQALRIEETERRIESLGLEHRELVHEQARLSAPGRIAAWARRNGMRLPDDIRPLHPFGEDQAAPTGEADPEGGGA